MQLKELLWADNIVIQCHDDPDADALASGWGVYEYFRANGKSPRFLYGGFRAVTKSNLLLMVGRLGIPVQHVTTLSDEPDLLITVDCRYGERNVQRFVAKNYVAIDHHQVRNKADLPVLKDYVIREHYGACATLVWNLLGESGYDLRQNRNLATALYYGLFMDTCGMQEIYQRADRDVRNKLERLFDESIMRELTTHNLSRQELSVVGNALTDVFYDEQYRFAIACANPCDPNILGIIADQINEVDDIDVCVVLTRLGDDKFKYSVRSCVGQALANEVAAAISGGGGHKQKAGGVLISEGREKPEGRDKPDGRDKPEGRDKPDSDGAGKAVSATVTANGMESNDCGCSAARDFIAEKLRNFFSGMRVVDLCSSAGAGLSGANGTDLSPDDTGLRNAPVYQKRPLEIGYIHAADVYKPGDKIRLMELEGDVDKVVDDDLYIMIGIDREVYTNTRDFFVSHNTVSEEPLDVSADELAMIEESVCGVNTDTLSLKGHIRKCIPAGGKVWALPLTCRTKVHSRRGDWYGGDAGDYLVSRVDNPKSVYIIKKSIFERTYEPAADGD